MSESNFSGVLRLTDLNNYLGPTKECIKPNVDSSSASKSVKIHVDEKGVQWEQREDGTMEQLKPSSVWLSDCLACSAESILVEAQSVSEFLSRIKNREDESGRKKLVVVVSVAHQSIASLSAELGITMVKTYMLLNTLFVRVLGCDYVFDTGCARYISLMQSLEEFIERYQTGGKLPLLTSSCPGWICYAEKSQDSKQLLDHVSLVKSPQQIAGVLVKSQLLDLINTNRNPKLLPSEVLHVAFMPCYDKKLEASRNEFYDPQTNSHHVDLVLTTLEIPQLLKRVGLSNLTDLELTDPNDNIQREDCNYVSLMSLSNIEMKLNVNECDDTKSNVNECDNVDKNYHICGVTGSSDSFAEFIVRHAADRIFNEKIDNPIVFKSLQNRNFCEFNLMRKGQKVLSFAIAYGFRNIQAISNQIKNNKCTYHYVEIMACPEGCLNGGGQLRPTNILAQKKHLSLLKEQYQNQQMSIDNPRYWSIIQSVYEKALRDRLPLRTTYKSIGSRPINPLSIQW